MKRFLALIVAAACLALCGCQGAKDPYEGVPNPIATIELAGGGTMRAELFVADAPNTVANFIALANSGFYDGMLFHRIVAGVLVQTGDPVGDGYGDPGYAIEGEFLENGIENPIEHTRGTLSMSRTSDYNSAGSQFFILQGTYSEYNGEYAAFGRLMDDESFQTLDKLAAAPTDSQYRPLSQQVVARIRVETEGFIFPVTTVAPDE